MSSLDLVNVYYEKCDLCPRHCHANRAAGRLGYCQVPAELKVARAALHFWEEPCISGEHGSGAVFFSGCSMGCVFCQNQEISHGQAGKIITIERLSEIFLELQAKGAHNINLVTPDHYSPSIAEALRKAKACGLHIPVLCNCSGYILTETLKLFEGLVDIWLPDFKYYSDEPAVRYSKAPDYFRYADAAIEEMYRQSGDPVFDEDGMIRRGIIVRHLTLPGQVSDSVCVIRHLYEKWQDHIYISIMNQFTPLPHLLPDYPELNTRIDPEVYDALIDYAVDLGVEQGFIQEGETAEDSFIPPFDYEGV